MSAHKPHVKYSERCGSPHAGGSTCCGCDPKCWLPGPYANPPAAHGSETASVDPQKLKEILASIQDPAAPRCKHDVHGTDCFECYPAPSGEDEADAEAYTEERSKLDYYNASIDNRIYCAFLAGRKGYVPQAEVERLRRELEGVSWVLKETIEVAHPRSVAEAVRAERERCAAIAAEHHILLGDAGADQIHRRILNPPEAE